MPPPQLTHWTQVRDKLIQVVNDIIYGKGCGNVWKDEFDKTKNKIAKRTVPTQPQSTKAQNQLRLKFENNILLTRLYVVTLKQLFSFEKIEKYCLQTK